jgi:hypothetical protein
MGYIHSHGCMSDTLHYLAPLLMTCVSLMCTNMLIEIYLRIT